MADAESITVASLTAQMIEEMIRGDQLLRDLRVRGPASPRPFTGVLVSPRMQAKLQLVVTKTRTASFVLRLFGEESTRDVLANIRLNFGVRPTPGALVQTLEEPTFTFIVPPFVRYGREGTREVLDFILSATHWFRATFSRAGRLEVYDPTGQLLSTGTSYSLHGLVSVIDRTAQWLREGAPGEAKAFDPNTQGEMGEFVRRVAGYYREIYNSLYDVTQKNFAKPNRTGFLEDFPAFDCTYELTDVYAKALLQLDGEGKPIQDPEQKESENWQQLDVEFRPGPGGVDRGLEISVRPPDFLVQGTGYHRKFLEALRTDNAVEKLWEEYDSGAETDFRRFLHHPSQERNAILVRIDATDHDLVLLSAELGSIELRLLYLVQFDVTDFPGVDPTVKSARLLGKKQGVMPWNPERVRSDAADMIERYLRRVFRTTRAWLRGVQR